MYGVVLMIELSLSRQTGIEYKNEFITIFKTLLNDERG